MYRAVVQYASDLFVNRWIQQAQSRMRARRAGGGSEEAGGEGPQIIEWVYIMGVLVILKDLVSLGLLCTMYNMFNTVCLATADVFSCHN
jgi:hypothetical protein